MKRNRIILCILSLLIVCSMAIHLTGCTTKVKATDLMKGVKTHSVSERQADNKFICSQMSLALKLFQESTKESEQNSNILISPLSIQLALAMTANGADGKTKAEMEKLLGGEIPLEELNEYLHSYVESLPSEKKYKLEIANSIWFRDDENRLNVRKDFLQTNADYYGAQAYKSAFDNQTLKDINNWVDEHTDGMIDKILDDIDPDTVMYLINALVFDAEWKKTYELSDIHDGKFNAITGTKQDVKMMESGENLYLDDGKATGFIKPYKDDKYSFAALLPNEGTDIYDYIAGLTDEGLKNTLQNARAASVNTTMPKFSYEYKLRMNDVLKNLGMPSAFIPETADFSKMADSGLGNIYIGEVLHKAFISVDELGTKAGAVTKVEMKDECAQVGEFTVKLDRPFVYMIIDNETNLPIFMGALVSIEK